MQRRDRIGQAFDQRARTAVVVRLDQRKLTRCRRGILVDQQRENQRHGLLRLIRRFAQWRRNGRAQGVRDAALVVAGIADLAYDALR